jgi:hypothetical protein
MVTIPCACSGRRVLINGASECPFQTIMTSWETGDNGPIFLKDVRTRVESLARQLLAKWSAEIREFSITEFRHNRRESWIAENC